MCLSRFSQISPQCRRISREQVNLCHMSSKCPRIFEEFHKMHSKYLRRYTVTRLQSSRWFLGKCRWLKVFERHFMDSLLKNRPKTRPLYFLQWDPPPPWRLIAKVSSGASFGTSVVAYTDYSITIHPVRGGWIRSSSTYGPVRCYSIISHVS